MERVISFFGLFVLMFIAWCFSRNKKVIDYRLVVSGLLLQFLLALIILKTDVGQVFFALAQESILAVVELSDQGAKFIFGEGFAEHFFAFKVLPTIIFASTLSYVLFYLGFLQKVVEALSWVMQRVMNISGAEALVNAANIFLGQTEAPLFVSPYLKTMTKAEIHSMMVCGMATVAGGVLAAYVGMGISAGHLLAASMMSAPAGILISRIMFPETEVSPTKGSVKIRVPVQEANIFEAACNGAAEGLKLALNVGAMLIAFIALVALVNLGLSKVAGLFGFAVTLQQIFGYVFSPLAFIMGIPWEESLVVGQFLGTKMVVNEFLAYMQLSEYVHGGQGTVLSQRAIIITTYALCGFANFSSIAVQIGGIGGLVPERKQDIARCGFTSMIGGTLAGMMTGCIAGMLI